MSDIRENVLRVREQMAQAAIRAGRRPEEILLCAASKMNDAARVQEAVAAGVDCCGENRVQELLQKLPLGAYAPKPVHFIGHLQTNKVRQVVGRVELIESVDRLELLSCIDAQAGKLGVRQDILLEVNIGMEASKSGFTLEQARELPGEMETFSNCRLRGFMAIPPVSLQPGANRRYFAEMYNLYVDISAKKYDNVSIDRLSMGMSGDFADAIAEGANLVRVGTAIFGARNYTVT